MAGEFRIVCVDRFTFAHGGSKIRQLGVETTPGKHEILSRDNVMQRMRLGERYFVEADGKKAFLIFGVSSQGRTFIQTSGDSTHKNNLNSLPRCEGDLPNPHGGGPLEPGEGQQEGGDGPDNPSGPQGPDDDP
ncbi:DUF3892 domain-containing protein [Streptomyces sp. CAU 1734]|uniref:DUF3892 domain-containing protein n=1 Tax=Streptomyces sp. CAU 1734 TaxID=3140360 RepID=UPI0032601F37